MPFPSAVFTEMVTTTDRSWGPGVTDNVSKHNALVRALKEKGNIKTFDGGYELVERLAYAENESYQRYSGFDQIDSNGSDVLTSAKYPNRQIVVSITASGQELLQNQGQNAMVSLAKEKKKVAMMTAANNFSVDVYSSGALSNQINGLANIIQTNGQGTVGGINSATFTFWRNKFREMTGTNLAATPTVANAVSLKSDMNQLYMATTRGMDKPDLIVMSHDFYALFEIGEQDKQRYMNADKAKAGYGGLMYKSAEVVFDDNTNFTTTGERAYFLNTDFLFIKQHASAQWTADTEKRPTNQHAVIVPIYWMGNIVCNNRSLQGILFDAA